MVTARQTLVTARTMAGSGTHAAPPPYQGIGTMPLAGEWRPGSSGKIAADTDPWSGDTLAEIPLAGTEDLDDAMEAARLAQWEWAAQTPADRAEVMLAAAEVVRARWAEITGWLIHETGAPAPRADLEWSLVRSAMLEAASVPHH